MKQTFSYTYTGKKSTTTTRYTLPFAATETTHTAQGSYWNKAVFHYSYYYEWLTQKETVLAECELSGSNRIQLTKKSVRIIQSSGQKRFALTKINNVEVDFKRLAFPLITGGIVAPLSVMALFTGLIHLWMGIALSMIGLMLFYYGWMGAYQVKLQFAHYQLTYFADQKSESLEILTRKLREMIAVRELRKKNKNF